MSAAQRFSLGVLVAVISACMSSPGDVPQEPDGTYYVWVAGEHTREPVSLRDGVLHVAAGFTTPAALDLATCTLHVAWQGTQRGDATGPMSEHEVEISGDRRSREARFRMAIEGFADDEVLLVRRSITCEGVNLGRDVDRYAVGPAAASRVCAAKPWPEPRISLAHEVNSIALVPPPGTFVEKVGDALIDRCSGTQLLDLSGLGAGSVSEVSPEWMYSQLFGDGSAPAVEIRFMPPVLAASIAEAVARSRFASMVGSLNPILLCL